MGRLRRVELLTNARTDISMGPLAPQGADRDAGPRQICRSARVLDATPRIRHYRLDVVLGA
jgi:hypothetical protein